VRSLGAPHVREAQFTCFARTNQQAYFHTTATLDMSPKHAIIQFAIAVSSALSSRPSFVVPHYWSISKGKGTISSAARWHASEFSEVPTDASPFSSLYGKTLVSVRESIDAYQQQHQQQQRQNSAEALCLPRVAFIDASWYHRPDPKTNIMRNPINEFQTGPRIPFANYLDIDALATTFELFPDENSLNLPHMMPPPSLFSLAMDAYGISNDDHIVIYAKRGAVFTPRTWFLFVSMGHDVKKVHLMQGSLEDWIEEGGNIESEPCENLDRCFSKDYRDYFHNGILNVAKLYASRNNFAAAVKYQVDNVKATHICDKDEVLQAVNNYLANQNNDNASVNTVIVDTRGSGYKQKGHMPSAIHLPYRSLLNPENPLQMLSKAELQSIFTEKGINYQDPNLKIILSCGSGVSVCHGFLALKLLGREISEDNTRVYDGSWKEWGRLEDDLPRILPHEINR
jgi:thiosulfate/3-mercaptopyruvate sulfurtransferase